MNYEKKFDEIVEALRGTYPEAVVDVTLGHIYISDCHISIYFEEARTVWPKKIIEMRKSMYGKAIVIGILKNAKYSTKKLGAYETSKRIAASIVRRCRP
jgi:hypothetical protein